jgi:2-dehydro-3-deoxyglucarate aldolase/4-hydroxy-2-oxoheptanedioate aldolase
VAGIFRTLLTEDRLIRVFSVGRLPHPVLIEMVGLAGGYDGIWLDQEHGGLTTEQITMARLTTQAVGLGCFVRLATPHYSLVNQALESGVDGVMAARVKTVEDAAEFVRWCKFAPAGLRGLNTGGADAHFTFKPVGDLVADANRDQFVAIQIETIESLNNVDAIAALDHVDLLFVGPADLSQELGITAQWHHDKLWEAIAAVAAACKKHGKAWGSVSPDPEFAARAVENGCRMLTFGGDVVAVRLGLEKIKQRYQNYFEG